MPAEHVLTPADRCPCGEPQEGSGYCSYECYSKHEPDPASMGEPLSEADRLAEIRARLDAAKDTSGDTLAEFVVAVNSGYEVRAHAADDLEFLLSRVGMLEGQLATTEDRALIEQGEVIKRDKAIKSLERALDEQRWYGEQLQASIEGCSGNHLEIEEYPGNEAEVTDLGHEFLPVHGHPDDDECTHRPDCTDDTYCGEPKAAHGRALGLDGGGTDAA